MRRQLGDRFSRIKGVGSYLERETLSAAQVTAVFQKDLQRAQQLSQHDPTGFFARKARMIETAMKNFKGQKDGKSYNAGYKPGLKYVYPGLPIEIAELVEAPIRHVIDLIASCDLVAATGYCCAGHPSAIVENNGISISTKNKSPFLFLVLGGDSYAGYVERDLPELSASGATSRLMIKISTYVDFSYMEVIPGMRRLSIRGGPQPFFKTENPSHSEVMETYQRALAAYWRRIQRYFEQVCRRRVPDPDPSWFKPRDDGWDREQEKILERNSNGRTLPNHYYFDGREIKAPVLVRSLDMKANHL